MYGDEYTKHQHFAVAVSTVFKQDKEYEQVETPLQKR